MMWKILAVTGGGVFFCGEEHLVENPEEAKWFDDISDLLDTVRDIMTLNLDGVVQVRLISDSF